MYRALYHNQSPRLHAAHAETRINDSLHCLLAELLTLFISFKRDNRGKELLFAQLFKRSSKFGLEYDYSGSGHNCNRILYNVKYRIHLKNHSKKNETGKHQNPLHEHPRLCILNPYNYLINQECKN